MTGKYSQDKDPIMEVVLEIGKNKPDLRISGMQNIHPIYEALIALLKQQIKNNEINNLITDNESLRRVLATDVFLEYSSQKNRNGLISLLKSGKSLREITDRAVLYMSENKRTKDGNVLYKTSQENPDKFFMKALAEATPNYIYVEKGELDRIKKRKIEIKRKDKIKNIALTTLATTLIIMGSCSAMNYKKIYKNIKLYREIKKLEDTTISSKKENTNPRIKEYLSSLELKI